jgi:hypothetical protein
MGNNYMKKLNLPAIKEIQIKVTLSVHLTPVRETVFNNTNNKCWQEGWWEGTLIHC